MRKMRKVSWLRPLVMLAMVSVSVSIDSIDDSAYHTVSEPNADLLVDAAEYYTAGHSTRTFNPSSSSKSLHSISNVHDVAKSVAHVQQILAFADIDDAAASGAKIHNNNNNNNKYNTNNNNNGNKKLKKVAERNLPAFLFNSDSTKIQSNAKNIENDSGRHFFYERNMMVEPSLPVAPIREPATDNAIASITTAIVGAGKDVDGDADGEAIAAVRTYNKQQHQKPQRLKNHHHLQQHNRQQQDHHHRRRHHQQKFMRKGENSKSMTKRRRVSIKRRLFKQLKGKRIWSGKKSAKHNSTIKISNESIKDRDSRFGKIPVPEDYSLLRNRRAVTAKKERIWDFGVIPYEIDHIFSGAHKALFKRAMRHWEIYTCIKFVERDPKVHPNYIFFTVKNCGCCSFVGKRGTGRQAISIGRNCEKFGIVVHELGHVIGFWHEHTRTDRDKHIIINKANIMKGQGYNFDVLSPADVDSLGLPYDYNSIMHYAKNTFSKSVYLDTIQPIGVSDSDHIEIGQRVRLSKGDIEQAKLLYKCPKCGRTLQKRAGKIIAPYYMYDSGGGGGVGGSGSGSGNGNGNGGNGVSGSIGSGDGVAGSVSVGRESDILNGGGFVGGVEIDVDSEVNGSEVDGGSGDYEEAPDKSLQLCEWRIAATNGERIILKIHQLNLMLSDDCTKDYLEIRDGYWHKSPIIRKLCGNLTSETIKSDSSRMLLRYANHNVAKGYRGFIADFEVVCGGDIFLQSERRIDSPNYPLQYLPDKECIWKVTVSDNQQVALKFQSFELENHDNCIYDYVEIRDGNDADSELIGIFCGSKLPPNIKTNSNQMYIKFVSDGTVPKVGFSAILMPEVDECKFGNHGCQHDCINTLGSYECGCFAGYELQANRKSCEDACGGIVDATFPNATLNSPSFPDVYPIAKECIWEVVAPINHAVFLNFSHFDLEGSKYQYTECNYDFLLIYSKLRNNRLKKIGVFCGNEIPPIINSEQNILRLEFKSDMSIQNTGFSARISIDADECSVRNGGCQHHCRNTFGSYICSCRNGYTLHENGHNCTETKCKFQITNSFGMIHSPNFPEDYPRNTYCFWHFRTVLGHRVQLTFHEFELEKHQECIYDFVAIHDGKSENSSTLGIYCGGREPYAVLSSTNEMFMVLRTDFGLQRKGFRATYTTECGGYLKATNHSQIFYSHPRYGYRTYNRNMYCNWHIQADAESSVKIKFLHFEVEYSERCDFDSVEITEEQSYVQSTNHGRYCGAKKPPVIVSYSDTILIHFQSDESNSLKGFTVSFVAVEPPYDDWSDDLAPVTPFPGYMKSIYYASDGSNDEEFDDRNLANYSSISNVGS